MLFCTRKMFVGERPQMINALRGHLPEHGLVAVRGPALLKTLAHALAGKDTALLTEVRELGQMYLEQIEGLNARIAELDTKMRCAAQKAEVVRRAQTMPSVDPVTALAVETFVPDLATFKRGRDFAAWLGLLPKQHSTGGKAQLGQASNPFGTMLRITLPGDGWDSATSAPSWSVEPWQSFRLSSGSTSGTMAG